MAVRRHGGSMMVVMTVMAVALHLKKTIKENTARCQMFCLRTLTRIRSRNVALQRLNGLRLAGDDPFDEVTDGDDADDGVILQDREMAKMVFCHQGHAFVHGVPRAEIGRAHV